MSTACRGLVCFTLLASGVGCAHFIESRAINRFAEHMREKDLPGLKKTTSPAFAEKALRTATALDDIKILKVPDGKVSVVEVEETDDHHRRVTVEVGETKKEVFYELVKDPTGTWVVDDIYLRQKKQGITAYKSLTEQMDLLLTVREFLDAWDGGDRDRVLAVTTPAFRQSLEQLPPAYLARLTARVSGERSAKSDFKPKAQMEESTAVVRLPRTGGETAITLKLVDEHWVVNDVAIDSKDELLRVPSVYKLALSVNACTQFLAAYQRDDKPALQPLCDRDFYEGCVKVADLKQVPLPHPQLADYELDVQLRAQRADFILRGEHELVQIDVRREDAAEPNAPPTFRVCDVTLYEMDTKQEKRLSALFTSQEMLTLFCRALAERDLDQLRHCATLDFSGRVWQRLNAATVIGLPLELFDDPTPVIVSTEFHGSLTKFEARQSGQPVTYLLREENGRFFVDDMQWQLPGRPTSVKHTLEALIPMKNFAAAIALARDPDEQKAVLEILQDTCSGDFNRMVWQQTQFVPNSGLSADTFLSAPLRSLTQSDTETIIRVGNETHGAFVHLKKENQRYVVDEVLLIAGPEQSERLAVKNTLRNLLSQGRATRPMRDDASLDTQLAAKPKRSAVQHAVYEEPMDDRGNKPHEILQTNDVIPIGPAESAPPQRLPR